LNQASAWIAEWSDAAWWLLPWWPKKPLSQDASRKGPRWRHEDVTEQRCEADNDRDQHHCFSLLALLLCCIGHTILRRDSRHGHGPSLPNVTTPFIDHSSGMWNLSQWQTALKRGPLDEKGEAMRKMLMALAAISTLAISAVAPAPAHAQRGVGAAIAGGIIGGAPAYVAGPGYGPCYWQRQRFWDGYAWRFRSVRVCE
jgi:hypothetical protein